jgi:hypothetical protein
LFNDNPDFYPTPLKLINKMLYKLDFKKIRTVLEPSAGKGDLVEAITKQFKSVQYHSRNDKKFDIDTIEIDENLQHILKGKGYRVIHDDFMSFSSYKRYDCIIANFPFSQDTKHLLKAIEIQQGGGQIICLINAESLKNPYSNSRKELVRLLDKYDAEVEFIENAFVNSDRSTGVEVALIHIDIPRIEYNSTIINELKKEELHKTTEYNSTHLIQSDFIRGIVEQYNYEIKAGLKLIDEYRALKPIMLRSFNGDNPVLKLELDYKDDSSTLENGYIKQIRSKYWSALFSNDQFMGLFTSNLKQKYMEMVEELKDYDFSFYNIYSLRIELSKEMVQGVEDTILNLFEEFSYKHYFAEGSKNIHYYNGWKTNKSYKINARVIIPLNAYDNWSGRFESTQWKVIEKIADIEKAFRYLDNEHTEEVDIKEVLKEAEKTGQTRKIELTYYKISFFKKGSAHIEFKDLELLAKLNLFAGKSKMWIPSNFGKVKYTNMMEEEKDIVDSFCGEEEYKKYTNNSEYYLFEPSKTLLMIEGAT